MSDHIDCKTASRERMTGEIENLKKELRIVTDQFCVVCKELNTIKAKEKENDDERIDRRAVERIKEVASRTLPLSESQAKHLRTTKWSLREIEGFLGAMIRSIRSNQELWSSHRSARIEVENKAKLMSLY